MFKCLFFSREWNLSAWGKEKKKKKKKHIKTEFWVISTNFIKIGQVIRLRNDINFSETACI